MTNDLDTEGLEARTVSTLRNVVEQLTYAHDEIVHAGAKCDGNCDYLRARDRGAKLLHDLENCSRTRPASEGVVAAEDETTVRRAFEAWAKVEWPNSDLLDAAWIWIGWHGAWKHRALAAPPVNAARVTALEELQDKVDGLEADLDGAVEVAWAHGATEWVRLNYPRHFERYTAALKEPKP